MIYLILLSSAFLILMVFAFLTKPGIKKKVIFNSKIFLYKFSKKISIMKTALLLLPVESNIAFMHMIDGEPLGWVKGSPVQNRIVSFFALIPLFLFIALFYHNKTQFKKVPAYFIAFFFFFWLMSFYLHVLYDNSFISLIRLISVYIVCAFFELMLIINIDIED